MKIFTANQKKHANKIGLVAVSLAAFLIAGCGGNQAPAQDENTDASMTQTQEQTQQTAPVTSPADGWTLHMTSKKLFPGNPDMTVNKYCKSVVGNMTQCQLYDGNDSDSRLVGLETIVGPEMYNTFTPDEKKLWMPTKDLMESTMTTMPDLDSEQFTNVAQSLAGKYSKVYLLWDPGKINLPTGSPVVTVMNTTVATGTTSTPPASSSAGSTPGGTPSQTPAAAPTSNGGYSFAAFDIAKLVSAGLADKKGNFDTSVLQRNSVGSLELYSLKNRIGLHQYTNTTHLMFIVSGKGEFTIGDKKVPVSGGMVVIIPAGTPHAFQNLGGKDTPLVFVTFKNPYDENDMKWLE